MHAPLVSHGPADRIVAQGPFEAEGKGVGAPMLMWAAQALKGQRAFELPPAALEVTSLARPVDARLRLVRQQQLDTEVHRARILGLGPTSAAVVSSAPTTLLGSVQLLFVWHDGGPAILGGKVVEISERAADGTTVVIRFEGIGWDTRGRLEALRAADGQGC